MSASRLTTESIRTRAFELGADGAEGEALTGPLVGRSYEPEIGRGKRADSVTMNGRTIFRFASRMMGMATERVLAKAGFRVEEIDLFIPHQANLRIIEVVARDLGLSMEKVYVNLHRYGNVSSASIPIAWCEAIEAGALRPGDRVAMAAVGGGLTWGALVAEWVPAQNEVAFLWDSPRGIRNPLAACVAP